MQVLKKEKKIVKLDRRKKRQKDEVIFSKLRLKRDIMREAKVLNMHMGAVESIADRVVDEVEKWIGKRGAITKSDLTRVTASKLKKYNPDLSYIYKNRDKII